MIPNELQIFLVGGAVRDELLGIPLTDKDFVVVGSTAEELSTLGLKPVGKDFPVFLHPETGDEYALARTEKKKGQGHQGFVFYTHPSVTLEEDLGRRDFTVNAIAKNKDGQLIDPFDGQKDLKEKTLRHISNAFSEDPLRVLRACRFLSKLDFVIHPHTLELMTRMVASGQLATLSPQRIWNELKKGLSGDMPSRMAQSLIKCGALKALMPDSIFNEDSESDKKFLLDALNVSVKTNTSIETRVALFSLLAVSNEFFEHSRSRPVNETVKVVNFLTRLHASRTEFETTRLVTNHLHTTRTLDENDPSEMLQIILDLDSIRQVERYENVRETYQLLASALSDSAWNLKLKKIDLASKATRTMNHQSLVESANSKSELIELIRQARLETIKNALNG